MELHDWASATPDAVLDFWFPGDGHDAYIPAHLAFWTWRMRGGADATIRERFPALTEAAAKGFLDHWAATPRGRLALILALDQFSRTIWRDTPGAFAQDITTTRLALEGLENGHYHALPHVWEKQPYVIAISHCEGPDHLARMERVTELARALADEAPERLHLLYVLMIDQALLVRDLIARYGRHPHRNAVLGRISTPAEEAYIAAGEFPHQRKLPDTPEAIAQFLAARGLAGG